jgi:hypothetical protein
VLTPQDDSSQADKMNWTGGSLQRHSRNANNSLVSRQKQHFAKVRTALQNGGKSPATPFRPDYLHNEDISLGEPLPIFDLGSVQHTGHSNRSRGQQHDTRTSPRRNDNLRVLRDQDGRMIRATDSLLHHRSSVLEDQLSVPSSEDACGEGSHTNHAMRSEQCTNLKPDISKNDGYKKRKAIDDENEDEMMEVKRRKLLQKLDWVGLAPSRPASIRFVSRKEKNRFGKRREIEGRTSVPPNGRRDMTRHRAHDHGLSRLEMDTVARNGVEHIQIRFGSDALTSHQPTQRLNVAQSHANSPSASTEHNSSEPMLFENETQHTAENESLHYGPSVSSNEALFGSRIKLRDRLQLRPLSGHQGGEGLKKDTHSLVLSGEHNMDHSSFQESDDTEARQPLTVQVPAVRARRGEEKDDPRVHITHLFGHSQSHPFQLIFDRSSDRDLDEPWKAFAAALEHSSPHSSLVTASRLGALQLRKNAEIDSGRSYEPVAVWSQQATLGDRTCISTSSCIPAAWPQDEQADDQHAKKQAQAARTTRQDNAVHQTQGLDKSEELWRSFIFGADDSFASDTEQNDSIKPGRFAHRAKRELWSNGAASPFSSKRLSTSSSSMSAVKPRRRESVADRWQPLTSQRPMYTSSISSILQAYAENAQPLISTRAKRADGAHSAQVKEEPVTHASLDNNMSQGTGSSSSFLSTRARPIAQRPSQYQFGRTIADASIYDIPESNDWNVRE